MERGAAADGAAAGATAAAEESRSLIWSTVYGWLNAERSWNERCEMSTLTCVKPCELSISLSLGRLDSNASRVTALCVLIMTWA